MKPILLTALLISFAVAIVNAGTNEGLAAYSAKNYPLALKELTPQAEQGDARAQLKLGVMYANGQGVSQDYAKAASLQSRAAEQGNQDAQFNLAVRYGNGQGVPKNYVVAYALFNLVRQEAYKNFSVDAGKMTPAQISAGERLTTEIAKPNNLTKAIAAYLKNPV